VAAGTELCPVAGGGRPPEWSQLAAQSFSWSISNLCGYLGITAPYFALACKLPLWRSQWKEGVLPLPPAACMLLLVLVALVGCLMRAGDSGGLALALAFIAGALLVTLALLPGCDGAAVYLAIALSSVTALVFGMVPGGLLASAHQLWQADLWRAGFLAVGLLAVTLQMPLRRVVFVSYAHGDDTVAGRLRDTLFTQLCASLVAWAWAVRCDVNAMCAGYSISEFTKKIGSADRVIVIVTEKYLRSDWCILELFYLQQHALGDKKRFQDHVVPVVLDDAKIDTANYRHVHVLYWQSRLADLEMFGDHLSDHERELVRLLKQGPKALSDILSWLADPKAPRGYQAVVADDFRMIREHLDRQAND
jgi:hypothetical protein